MKVDDSLKIDGSKSCWLGLSLLPTFYFWSHIVQGWSAIVDAIKFISEPSILRVLKSLVVDPY